MARKRHLAAPERPDLGSVIIRASDVGVKIGSAQILRNVSMDLRIGEVLAVVGPNGAGKSTLLSVLAGDRTYSGSVVVGEKNLQDYRPPELALQRAVLRQDNPLSFPFSVLDVVKMGRAPWQRITSPAEDERIIAQEMSRVNIVRFAERIFPSLSGGERARVSLARVLTQRTPILFLDEPTAALDINYQEHVLAIARQVARTGTAVLVVLHDLAAAAAYADRVLLLADGERQALGTPEEVFTSARLSQVYGHPISVTRDAKGALHIVPIRFADDAPAPASALPPKENIHV